MNSATDGTGLTLARTRAATAAAFWMLPRSLMRTTRRGLVWLFYERRLGVTTTGSKATVAVKTDGEQVGYSPSRWRLLKSVLRDPPVGPEDVFLDLGAGLGRVLVQASQLPFRRVIGVELSPELTAAARLNLARSKEHHRCGEVEVVLADASTYEVPDDVTVVFLYNPFTGLTFQRAIDNVHASLERNPRRIRIIYDNPVEHARLISAGAELERTHRPWRPYRARGRSAETRVYSLTVS